MSVEKQFQSIMNSISSLESSLNELQSHADQLHGATQMNVATDFDPDAEMHSDFTDKIQTIKNQVMDKSVHLERVISSGIDASQIQRKMDMMLKVQERMNYYKSKQ